MLLEEKWDHQILQRKACKIVGVSRQTDGNHGYQKNTKEIIYLLIKLWFLVNTSKKRFTLNFFAKLILCKLLDSLRFLQMASSISNKCVQQRPFHKTEEIEILFYDKLRETEKHLGTNAATFSAWSSWISKCNLLPSLVAYKT